MAGDGRRLYEPLVAPTREDVGEESEVSVDGNGEEAERAKHAVYPRGALQANRLRSTGGPTSRSGCGKSGAY